MLFHCIMSFFGSNRKYYNVLWPPCGPLGQGQAPFAAESSANFQQQFKSEPKAAFRWKCGPIKCCCTASCPLFGSNKRYYNVLWSPCSPINQVQTTLSAESSSANFQQWLKSMRQKLHSDDNMDPSNTSSPLCDLHFGWTWYIIMCYANLMAHLAKDTGSFLLQRPVQIFSSNSNCEPKPGFWMQCGPIK